MNKYLFSLFSLFNYFFIRQALVHVSTAYCNCNRQEVNEVVYPPPADPEKIIQCVEWMDDKLIDTVTPQ